MFVPSLNETKKRREYQIEFQGLNHNYVVGEDEFYNMTNMSSDYYPVLAPRGKRKSCEWLTEPYDRPISSMTSVGGKLAYVMGTYLFYDNEYISAFMSQEYQKERQLVPMGANICIFPDNEVFNTLTGEVERMERSYKHTATDEEPITYTVTVKGEDVVYNYTGRTEPLEPKDTEYWMDTSGEEAALKQYSEKNKMWISVPTVYTKITSVGIGNGFRKGDGVSITGEYVNLILTEEGPITGNYILQDVTDDSITVINLLHKDSISGKSITMERTVPKMDYVCEHNNRLWGCNSEKHEIYACKLGDPTNWNVFEGISTDAYALTVGSDGDFTGCVSFRGQVIFFKEDVIHKLYGTKPSNFQLSDVRARGVQRGSHESLAQVNEVLYYKSRDGVCAYDGSLPVEISQKLGKEKYFDANGGGYGNKYYLSMRDENGTPHLFVYDTSLYLWHREDNFDGHFFTNSNGALYCVNKAAEAKRLTILCDSPENNISDYIIAVEESDFAWEAETGDLFFQYPDRRYLSRLLVRAELAEGSEIKVWIDYDHQGTWQEVYRQTATEKKTCLVPIKTKRCDTVRLKIGGTGDAKILGLGKTLELGSDVL